MIATSDFVAPRTALAEEPFYSYAYSYPHKSSYRPLSPAVPIVQAWQNEIASSLSLYVHLPFCEMRCGFCNLFAQSQPAEAVVERYLAALARQMRVVFGCVPQARFTQAAIGGGTPTFLSPRQLETLLTSLDRCVSPAIREIPTSVETSPATAAPDRLRVLADFGVQRISLGVQSFAEEETQRLGRPQNRGDVRAAIESIRDAGFSILNLDLIYGAEGQTLESWMATLREALHHHPEELYLYPLYVRPQTGLARRKSRAVFREELYFAARDLLCERGYVQASLRCFRLPQVNAATAYACQRDGMIGLGCGARSYTRRLHYATRFATTQAGVRAILDEWIEQTDEDFSLATHGVWLSDDEQRRRYVIMSLLQSEGLSLEEYRSYFTGEEIEETIDLSPLYERGWLRREADRLVLTPQGLAHSDAAGPLLYSRDVLDRLRAFVARNE